MTKPTPEQQRAAYIDGLRQLADLLTDHTDVPTPFTGSGDAWSGITVYHAEAAAETLTGALGTPGTIRVNDHHLYATWRLAGLHLTAMVGKAEERVTGVRIIDGCEVPVYEPVIPEHLRAVTKIAESAVAS